MTAAARTTRTTQLGSIIAGRYRITGVLGRGGMGRVFRAEHITIRRQVAIKLLDKPMRRMPELNQRLEREAFAMGRVSHPNCVTISDCGTLDDGSVYLAMELLDGRTLAEELQAVRRMPVARALHIGRHILHGLAHAHSVGVVHRDIKPENIFLVEREGDRDYAKIVDFGIAKLVGDAMAEAGGKDLTADGLAIGSPTYMSPEQALGDTLDGRSDLYSLSVMLYELIAGRPPFWGDDKLAVVRMHLGRPIPPMASIAGEPIPDGVETLLLRGLHKRPAERIASATDYLAAIERLLHGDVTTPMKLGARALSRSLDAATVPRAPSLRRTRALAGLGAVLAVAIAAVAIAGSSGAHGSASPASPTAPSAPKVAARPPVEVTRAAVVPATEAEEPEPEPEMVFADEPGADEVATTAGNPKATAAFRAGRTYCRRMWRDQCFDYYRRAIQLDPSYRTNDVVIRDAVSGLMSNRPGPAHRFIVEVLGEAAIPQLEWSARHSNSLRISRRSQSLLDRLRATARR